jgi:uncharacterized protein (TIRG00374 family)
VPIASFGGDVASFFDAAGQFFDRLAHLRWGWLVLGLALFGAFLTVRNRGYFNALRAAYPQQKLQWRRVWGAYVVAFGLNSVIPARGGEVVKLFLLKTSVPNSTYPAIGSSLLVESVFELTVGIPVLIFAFTQGVFPKPPDFASLHAFDLSFFASHFELTLFLLTALSIVVLVAFAVLSRRVKAFWRHARQGVTILFDRRRWFREVWCWQFAGWLIRWAALWALLEAFGIPASLYNVALVIGVNAVAGLVPFTPGGAGVQQALLANVFSGTASGATVAAYSVGQQVALAAFSLALAFVALVTIFRFRSFGEVIRAGRAHHAEAKASEGRGAEDQRPAEPEVLAG